jgi:hypothetical protein
MMDEIKELIDQYTMWLRDKTALRQVTPDWVEITTPYLDRHNDYLQIYARQQNGHFLITDDGYIIEDLVQSGCKLDTPKREALLKMTLNGFGVQLHEGELRVQASVENFGRRKHDLIQAMLAVNDMFYMAVPLVASLFYEDVVAWLDTNDIRYTPGVKFTGKSGYDHLFDFVIPKSRNQPERIIQTINRPSRDRAEAAAFAWIDTREVRPANSRAYAFLNDQEQRVPVSALTALENYQMKSVVWSGRDEVLAELVA